MIFELTRIEKAIKIREDPEYINLADFLRFNGIFKIPKFWIFAISQILKNGMYLKNSFNHNRVDQEEVVTKEAVLRGLRENSAMLILSIENENNENLALREIVNGVFSTFKLEDEDKEKTIDIIVDSSKQVISSGAFYEILTF